MTKKQSKRAKRPSNKPATDEFVSPIGRMLVEQAAAMGPDYISDNFVRIMRESVTLRDEPEFADFYLDPMQMLEALTRHFPRFRRQLMRVLRRRGKLATAYDDYRIAVLDDMVTPQLRRQLRRRLDRCTNRLKLGRDVDKLEIALFLLVLFGDKAGNLVDGKKPLPLYAYGLVTTIYEDSFDQAMVEVPSARDIVGDDLYELWCFRCRERHGRPSG